MGRPRKTAAPAQPTAGIIPVVGDVPFYKVSDLDVAEQQYFESFRKVLSGAILGNRNPIWNDQEELSRMREIGFSVTPPGSSANINERFSKRHPVADLNIPRDPIAIMQTALRYCYDNPFVAKGVKVKTDFIVKDFKHRTTQSAPKDFFDQYAIKLQLRIRLREIVWLLCGVGVAPIWWGGEDGGPITFLEVLDPRTVHIERILGRTKLYLRVDTSMVDAVQDPKGEKDIRNKARFDSMPKYWIDQIEQKLKKGAPRGYIELKDGSYTVIQNRYAPMNRTINSLDGIPLQPAFDALQRYRLIAAGDFAVAWNVKNMITLISEGDPKVDVKSYAPSDTHRLQNLQANFQRPDYAFTVFCDPTTQVRYVVPPIEVFDPKKYAQVEKEIKECLNLPSFMWNTDGGGTFGAASAELKVLREEVDSIRLLLEEELFRPLYARLRTGAAKPGFASKDICLPTFDQNSLREDAVWLTQFTDLHGRGGASLRSLAEVYGLDFDYEMAELAKEHEDLGSNVDERDNPTTAQPLFESSQGNMMPNRDKGGNSGDKTDKPRNPRTKGK